MLIGAAGEKTLLNPNLWFRWLSIRSKLTIAFVGLSLAPMLIIGLYVVRMKVEMMEQSALDRLTDNVQSVRTNTAAFLRLVESDLRALRGSAQLGDALRGGSSTPFAHELLAFATAKRLYYEIQFFDADSIERSRVVADDPGDSASAFHLVAADSLSMQRGAAYFHLAEGLDAGNVAITPSELLVRDGRLLPVFTFVTPVNAHGSALLVAHVYARDLFAAVVPPHPDTPAVTIAIVNGQGVYLYHSIRKAQWNRLLAEREEEVVSKDYTEAEAQAIGSDHDGSLNTQNGDIVRYSPIASHEQSIAGTYHVFASIPRQDLLRPVYGSAAYLVSALLSMLALATLLAFLATRQFTSAVSQLQRGAEILAQGEYNHRLDINTHDEIETLAGHFNLLARALEQHEDELQSRRASLEEVVASRTAELADEKMRLQTIIDNVPTAFVLLDGEYHRLKTSASFARVTGRPIDDGTARCPTHLCEPCLCVEAGTTRSMLTHVDVVPLDGGGERFLEHTAIPHFDGDRLLWVLEMITDISERRVFEARAIRNERLLAVGETAAFVAHQIRNGLTSIKMIVQLRGELQSVPPAERRALEIVLGSISHLEQVVTNLLAFARPGPIVPMPASLNTLATDAAAFVRPQFAAAGIMLKLSLDPDLPRVPLDTTLVREAIIALLLNGVEAIGTDGTVSVRTMQDGDGVRLEVEDTGTGISAAAIDHMFEPFFTTKPTGNGLGLAMARRIVEAHGGTARASNVDSGGALFTFVFPIAAT